MTQPPYQVYPGGPPAFGPPSLPPLPPGTGYASYGSRVAAYLLDVVLLFACLIPAGVAGGVAAGLSDPVTGEPPVWTVVVAVLVALAGIAAWLRSYVWQNGSRGQSWGKRIVGIHLVNELSLRPPGGWTGVARYALRSGLGNATCGLYALISMLWPLWDERSQSLDDKILHTLVVRFPDRPSF